MQSGIPDELRGESMARLPCELEVLRVGQGRVAVASTVTAQAHAAPALAGASEDASNLLAGPRDQEGRDGAGSIGVAEALEDLAGGRRAQMFVFRKMKLGTRWMMVMMGHQIRGT